MGFFDALRAVDTAVNTGRYNRSRRQRRQRRRADRRAGAPVRYSHMVFAEERSTAYSGPLVFVPYADGSGGSYVHLGRPPVNHWKHGVLTVLTSGLWAPIWYWKAKK